MPFFLRLIPLLLRDYNSDLDETFRVYTVSGEQNKNFSKRMIKEFENKKAGLGNKLKFILTAKNGSQFDFEHPKDMDEILKGQCVHFYS